MIKLYPSKLAFCVNGVLQCEYESQCQRYQIFMRGKWEEIDPKYKILGEKWEDIISGRLSAKGVGYRKEVPFKVDISDELQISGRVDYIVDDVVLECKGSYSAKFLSDVIRAGKVKLSHLAQISAYFILTGTSKAKLLAGFFKEKTAELANERFFKVKLQDSGDIHIDKTPSGYNLSNLVDGAVMLSEALKNDDLMTRPIGAYHWSSVCKYCKFNQICDRVDVEGLPHKEAIELSKEIK